MSLSMAKESQGKWEYVSSKKEKDQGKRVKKAELKLLEPTRTALSADSTASAFAALDKWQREQESRSDSEDEAGGEAAVTSDGFFTAAEEANLQINGNGKQKKAVPVKKKEPKVKKVKVLAKDVAAGLQVPVIKARLDELEKSYKDSHVSQCEMLADYMWKTFKDADLPFNRMLTEQPLEKVADVPLQYVSKDVVKLISNWLASRDSNALQQLCINLITAVYDGLPDFKSSKQATVQPPKAKVGLLLLLSMLLRVEPAVLVPLCPALLVKGSDLVAPLRIPQTHWVLSQAAMSGEQGLAVGIHVWCSVVLPQVLGTSLAVYRQEPKKCPLMQKETALSSISWFMGVVESVKSVQYRAATESGIIVPDDSYVPVVPPGAVEMLARTVYGGDLEHGEPSVVPKGIASKAVRDSAGALLADLRELDLNGGAAAETALVLALETAEGSRGPCEGAGSQLVSESACSVVSTLMASDAAFAKWQDKHKKMIKGSARVLQHLAEAQPPKLAELLSSPEKATLFSKLLCEIRGRHRLYLETGKGWQGACAMVSESASLALAKRAKKAASHGSSRSPLLSTVLIAGSAALLGIAIYTIAEPNSARSYAAKMGLPAEMVDQVFRMVPPEYTAQMKAGLAAASAGGRGLGQRLVAAVPPQLVEKITPVLKEANHTILAVALQATEVWNELVKQYSH